MARHFFDEAPIHRLAEISLLKMLFPNRRNLLLLPYLVLALGLSDAYYFNYNQYGDGDALPFPPRGISFLAWYSKHNKQLGNHEAVKYNQVIENLGNGYSPSTGKFTAPVTGIYSISVTMMSARTNFMHLRIMKNSQFLTALFSNKDTYPQASTTLNVFLKKGDTAWVQRQTGRVLEAHMNGRFNVFSGVLITPM